MVAPNQVEVDLNLVEALQPSPEEVLVPKAALLMHKRMQTTAPTS